jgi:glycosyltransferase involved in cell wall biosynthesis
VEFFTPGSTRPESYFLVVSALVPYKRIEVAIQAARRLGQPLKIVGGGPDLARLRAVASPDVEFLGQVDHETLRTLYRGARALVLPAEEDFGIAPIEAMACGTPVIAFGRGGATETVEHSVTGLLVDRQSPDSFAEAMSSAMHARFDPGQLVAHASGFSVARFESAFQSLVHDTLRSPSAC